MHKLLVRGLFAAALAFGSLSLTACPAPYALPTTSGADLKEDFWSAYYPDFKKDMAWTFDVDQDGTSTGTYEWKVTEVKDGVAYVAHTFTPTDGTATPGGASEMTKNGLSSAKNGFKYEATETVKLAAGEFKDAVKATTVNWDGKIDTYWIARGVGIIKVAHASKTTISLKSKSF